MNLDQQLKKFKQFENDDQKFWEEVTGGKEPEPPKEVRDGTARMKLREDMVVQNEIVDHLFEEDFSTAEESDIQKDLEKKLEALGLDSGLAQQVIRSSRQATGPIVSPAAEPFSPIPQKQWQEARKRLNEEAQRTAKLLLNRTGLKHEGIELPRKLKPEIGAKNNFIAALQMVNEGIAKRNGDGRKRLEWSTAEYIVAMDQLPEILNSLTREIKKAQNAQG